MLLSCKTNKRQGTGSSGIISTGGGGVPDGLDSSSVIQALTILAQIIGATIVIVLLFKYGCFRVLFIIIGIIVVMLLGLFGWILITALLVRFNLALDYVSLILYLWNFVIVGVVVIFWKGPMQLQQAYLVQMSSMMVCASFTVS